MYIHIYIYIYLFIYLFIYVHTYLYISIFLHMYVCICACVYIYIYICIIYIPIEPYASFRHNSQATLNSAPLLQSIHRRVPFRPGCEPVVPDWGPFKVLGDTVLALHVRDAAPKGTKPSTKSAQNDSLPNQVHRIFGSPMVEAKNLFPL